jgi:hypothetical protein
MKTNINYKQTNKIYIESASKKSNRIQYVKYLNEIFLSSVIILTV